MLRGCGHRSEETLGSALGAMLSSGSEQPGFPRSPDCAACSPGGCALKGGSLQETCNGGEMSWQWGAGVRGPSVGKGAPRGQGQAQRGSAPNVGVGAGPGRAQSPLLRGAVRVFRRRDRSPASAPGVQVRRGAQGWGPGSSRAPLPHGAVRRPPTPPSPRTARPPAPPPKAPPPARLRPAPPRRSPIQLWVRGERAAPTSQASKMAPGGRL